MKNLFFWLLLTVILTACSPSESVIQTAIAQTLTANPSTICSTASPLDQPTIALTETIPSASAPTATPEAIATPGVGSQSTPIAFGEAAALAQEGVRSFQFQVSEVVRGEEAYSMIYAANKFNNPPPRGYEFVMIHVQVTYLGTDEGVLILNKFDTAIVTSERIIEYYDTLSYSPCCLEPDFNFQLLAGGAADGWLALPVTIDDPNPLLVLGIKEDGTGGIYFSLTP